MFQALKLKQQKTPEQAVATLEELRVREADLLQRYDELALAAADGGDQALADRAHVELVRCRDAVVRAESLRQAIERREQRARADAAAATIDAAWADTLAKARDRVAKAARFEAKFKEAADEYAELVASNVAVHRALPVGYPIHAASGFAIENDLLAGLLRILYSRHRMPGGPHLGGLTPPSIERRYTEAVTCIEQARELSREAAAHG
ncbi:hypothetical protein [Rhodanobacter sp. L36]|uniref:hypothetical protein n=1 Tax=Rhodanobacter sp. L36 TaxID=1747221 RepID=UPI00131D3C9D|nr:hypothetical protein [Rhodanobacter sp. L36]